MHIVAHTLYMDVLIERLTLNTPDQVLKNFSITTREIWYTY